MEPADDANVPAVQALQLTALVLGLYVPAGQVPHVLSVVLVQLVAMNCPTPHVGLLHTAQDAASVVVLNLPLAHVPHDLSDVDAQLEAM